MDLPKQQHFEAAVGSSFSLPFDNGETFELRLDSYDASAHLDDQTYRNYSLIFSGPDHFQLQQATFTMNHEVLGTFMLFLVPIGKTEGRVQYQAVVSCLAEA